MRAEEVAKKDKSSLRASLAFLRCNNQVAKCLDGWDLVHVGLAAVRELDPDSWERSFKKVNLHPHHRVPFGEWCKRIEGFLQGGESFTAEDAFDAYALLPHWWHQFAPEEKTLAVEIFGEHEFQFNMECVRMLHDRLHVPLDDMQNLRVCIDHAIEDPSHLERRLPDVTVQVPAEAAEAQAALVDVNDGLISFQLHPKKPDGSQLFTPAQKFDHLIKMARRSVPVRDELKISDHLDIAVSKEQSTVILNPTPVDYMMHTIASHTTGEGAKRRVAKRKLDALGSASGVCGVLNDGPRLLQLKNQLCLTESIATINKQALEAKQQTLSLATAELLQLAPAAVQKLKGAQGDAMQLFIKDMDAIAFASFNGAKLSGDKKAKAAALTRLMEAQPEVLGPMHPAITVTATVVTDNQGALPNGTAVPVITPTITPPPVAQS